MTFIENGNRLDMDPNQTLADIEDSLIDHENEIAVLHAKDLMDWLESDGFEPDWSLYPMAALWFQSYRNIETLRDIRAKLAFVVPADDARDRYDEVCVLVDVLIKALTRADK